MEVLERAIAIEEENNKTRPTKSLLLGRMHFCRATIMQSLKNFKEARKSYEKAKEVFQY